MIIVEFVLLIFVLAISLFSFFISISFFFGAPFVTTPKKIISEMIKLAKPNKNDVAIDLGSGDGRMLIESSKFCKKAIGYEINPFLVVWSKLIAFLNRADEKVDVKFKNYKNADLKNVTVVFLYSIRGHIHGIENKLKKELRSGTKVISYKFPLSNFKLVKKTKTDIYLYSV